MWRYRANCLCNVNFYDFHLGVVSVCQLRALLILSIAQHVAAAPRNQDFRLGDHTTHSEPS